MTEFVAYPKIPRLFRDMVITEKIDGTNACVVIDDNGIIVGAQSRKRIVTKAADNHGFAAWVTDNLSELSVLGPGYHYGEWYGKGIQRGYGLEEKRFALFNPYRYEDIELPDRVDVVPTLDHYTFDSVAVARALRRLREEGSAIAPGFMDPEGIIVYHTAARQTFKVTLEGDDRGKEWGA